MYAEERKASDDAEDFQNAPLPVPDWLWRERALYTLDPPDDESKWDPTPPQMESSAVCYARILLTYPQVVKGAEQLKKGIMICREDWSESSFEESDDDDDDAKGAKRAKKPRTVNAQ